MTRTVAVSRYAGGLKQLHGCTRKSASRRGWKPLALNLRGLGTARRPELPLGLGLLLGAAALAAASGAGASGSLAPGADVGHSNGVILAFLGRLGRPASAGEHGGTDFKQLPADVADAVSATAAESLLMGVFVLVCSFELRGVKAGSTLRQGNVSSSSHASLPLARGASGGFVDSERPLQMQPMASGSVTPRDADAGSIYGVDDGQDLTRMATPGSRDQSGGKATRDQWQIGPLVMMMILLHVIYPSFPLSPQVEVGRIMTFLGFLWSVGPLRCITVVNTEPMHKCRLLFLTILGACVHACIFIMTDTINDLIFPDAAKTVGLYQGPRYLHQLLMYWAIRYPARATSSVGPWAAWCVVSAVVFSSAVWKEFLFRGVYLGGLRTRMPFWAANVTTALVYALAHEPLQLSSDGAVKLQMVTCAPLLMGAMWYGYLYQSSNNLVVTVLAHLLFNASLLALHLYTQTL